jgi:hypothetical protein
VAGYSKPGNPTETKEKRVSKKERGNVEDETSELEQGATMPCCQGDELTSEHRNALSHSQFAYVDSEGKGHLPIHDESHVRNAMARWNQTHFDSPEKKAAAKRKICSAARHFGGDLAKGSFCAEQGGSLSEENGCKNCEESRTKISALEGEVKALQASLAAFTKWKDAIVLQAQVDKATECADLEIEIGTLQAADREKRITDLSKLDPGALGPLAVNLKAVAAAQASLPGRSVGPKAQFPGNPNVARGSVTLQAALSGGVNAFVEQRRMDLFGYQRDANGKIVA